MNTPLILAVGGISQDEFRTTQGSIPQESSKQRSFNNKKTFGGAAYNFALAGHGFKEIVTRITEKNFDPNITILTKLGQGNECSLTAHKILTNAKINILDTAAYDPEFGIGNNWIILENGKRHIIIAETKDTPMDPSAKNLAQMNELIQESAMISIQTSVADIAIKSALLASKANKRFATDASEYKETLDEVLPHATDILLPNELQVPNTIGKPTTEIIMQYAREKASERAEIIAVLGGDKETHFYLPKTGQEGTLPVKTLDIKEICNTTGAGDTTRAVFSIASAYGAERVEALTLAQKVATQSCTLPDVTLKGINPEAIKEMREDILNIFAEEPT